MKRFAITFLIILFTVSLAAPVFAATWFIASDGSGDQPTIQDGINAASNGDTVLVGPGTFTGVGNYDIDFSGKAIAVVSQFGPASTTVDCQSNGRGFIFDSGETSSSVLQGLTITNAYSAVQGGAIWVDNTSPEICNNVLFANHAVGHGGGIGIKKGTPYVHNNTLVENSSDALGGGIALQSSAAPLIHQNIIAFSSAGAGIACIGGVNPTVSCNDIYGNAGGDGFCGTDGGGNGSTDPQFCGVTGSGYLYIQSDSPCAPGQSICGSLVGALGVNCFTVPTEENTWGAIKELFQ